MKAACTLIFTGWLLAVGLACAVDSPRALGNIDSSPKQRELPETSGIGGTSEWEMIREASEPAWAGDEADSAEAPSADSGAVDHPAESKPGAARTPVGTPDDALVVVDHQNGLPPDYTPDDLVPLQPLDVPTLRGESMKLRAAAAEATARMLADARKAGFELLVCSAYRSYEAQIVSYGRLTAIHGEEARAFSAPPGHSEHQLGTVVDVSNAETDYRLHQSFGETEASEWIRQNAAEYGFVLSYPRGAEEHTKYHWEPWHYRYIGRENALRYREGDYASPQQYFLRQGVLPGK